MSGSTPPEQASSATAAFLLSPKLPANWRQTTLVGTLAGLCSSAAALTQFASKVNASAAFSSKGQGAVQYDAGWPFTYAHVARSGLSASRFASVLHSFPRLHTIAWGAFTIDVVILTLILVLAVGIVLGGWTLAWYSRPSGSTTRFLQTGSLGLTLAAGWLALSFWIISGINAAATTDGATVTQITRPPAVLLLAPGVGQYLAQRWLAGDNGLAIALTGGPIATIATVCVWVISVALPAALLAVLIANGMRLRARWATS